MKRLKLYEEFTGTTGFSPEDKQKLEAAGFVIDSEGVITSNVYAKLPNPNDANSNLAVISIRKDSSFEISAGTSTPRKQGYAQNIDEAISFAKKYQA